MPLYLNLHKIHSKAKEDPSFTPKAHPLKIHDSCRCLSAWIDLEKNYMVSLLDLPDESALYKRLNRNQFHEIIPVNSKVAEVFLERLKHSRYIPTKGNTRFKILKNAEMSRVLLFVSAADPFLLRYRLGEKAFVSFQENFQQTINDNICELQGKQIHLENNHCRASFISVFNALNCALKVKKKLSPDCLSAKIKLFLVPDNASAKPDLLSDFHFHSETRSAIVIASQIKNMCGNNVEENNDDETNLYWLPPSEENLLRSLLQVLNQNWQDPKFNCREFCRKIAMSKPSLYRKCTAVTGRSPNELIKEFRLLKALKILRSGESVTRTCYDSGFNSASYFSHCFQQQFNIQPNFYRRLCQN